MSPALIKIIKLCYIAHFLSVFCMFLCLLLYLYKFWFFSFFLSVNPSLALFVNNFAPINTFCACEEESGFEIFRHRNGFHISGIIYISVRLAWYSPIYWTRKERTGLLTELLSKLDTTPQFGFSNLNTTATNHSID